MEKVQSREIDHNNKIRFLNVVNEGHKWFSFVVCPTKTANVVLYAWLNKLEGTTHTTIFELAVEEYGFNDEHEPIGGGVINTETCEMFDSLHYGGINDEAIERAVRHRSRCE